MLLTRSHPLDLKPIANRIRDELRSVVAANMRGGLGSTTQRASPGSAGCIRRSRSRLGTGFRLILHETPVLHRAELASSLPLATRVPKPPHSSLLLAHPQSLGSPHSLHSLRVDRLTFSPQRALSLPDNRTADCFAKLHDRGV